MTSTYHLTEHNRISYEKFMRNDLNKIIDTSKIFVFKNPTNDGGTFNTEIQVEFQKKETTKEVEFTPMECRLLGKTYDTSIEIGITLRYKIFNDEYNEITFPKPITIKMPIMLHSNLCVLHKKNQQELQEFKESIHESGGYFVINGNEKIIVSQEDKRLNFIYTRTDTDDNLVATIDSKVENKRPEKFMLTFHKKSKTISATIPYFKGDIPLFTLFRALGFTTDKQILEHICNICDDETSSIFANVLYNSIHENASIYTQDVALKTLSLFTKNKATSTGGRWKSNLLYLLNTRLFPHIQNETDDYFSSLKKKAVFLAFMTRELILTELKMKPLTDRDAIFNKQVRVPGEIMNEMFLDFWENYLKDTKRKIDVHVENHRSIYFRNNTQDEIQEDLRKNAVAFFNINDLQQNINKSFMGKWGKNPSSIRNEGVLQTYQRHSFLESLSHLRRFHLAVASRNSMQQRRVQNSQFGFVCPIETPDGGDIGTRKHFAATCKISEYFDPKNIIALIKKNLSFKTYEDNRRRFDNACVVLLVNGELIGTTENPKELVTQLRNLKTSEDTQVHYTTSIAWKVLDGVIEILTSGGRLIRPLLLQSKSPRKFTMKQILVEYDMDDFVKAGCEFVDANESDTLLIGFSEEENTEHTHFEISKNSAFGISALTLPFFEHNPVARNLYATSQCRATVGVYASNHNSRFDQKNSLSHYSQKPLMSTGINSLLNNDETPYGTNVIVAIAACNGFNQEDAIILNKSAVERGMFKSSYHSTYSFEECGVASTKYANEIELKKINKSDDDIKFIVNFDTVDFEILNKKSNYDYTQLDENGMIRENVSVKNNTVLVSAVTFKNGKYYDASLTVSAHDGDLVEKVFLSKEFPRIAKIQTYQRRFPITGDKFASRAAQKATIGLMLKQGDMPYTQSGIVPDLIFNPHSFPSRMTMSYFNELLCSLIGIETGSLVEIPTFGNTNTLELKHLLTKLAKHEHPEETSLYSADTGELVNDSVCFGPVFYQRLKQQAQDKAYSLGYHAPLDAITRQPLGGRAAGGGLKMGQMERDSMLAHGATSFMKEAFYDRADAYEIRVDQNTGQITHKKDSKRVQVPYAFKLLMQEIQSMNIAIKLNVE